MEKQKEKLGIETGDFITPGKAITMSTISLLIWFLTGVSYKLLSLWFIALPYESYALVVSLALSVLFSILIVIKLVIKADVIMKIFVCLLNTILIYTSANGAQATYSFLSPPDNISSQASQKVSLIPFLDSRPWIPDKFLKAENETLANENSNLLSEKENLLMQNGLLQKRIGLIKDSIQQSPKGIQNDNIMFRDSIAILLNNLAECKKQNEKLSGQLNSLGTDELERQRNKSLNESDNSKTQAKQESFRNLERQNATCQKKNDILTRQLESLQGRINQFNIRQGLWSKTIELIIKRQRKGAAYQVKDPAIIVKQQVNAVMKDSTFYDFLFLMPINTR